jgi:cyclic pyranopterin phosphate synthase
MVAVHAACLTLYDMAKALDRGIVTESVVLLEKSGGRSGVYKRPARSRR